MDEMNITSAQYYTNYDGDNAGITLFVGEERFLVPLQPGNRHYDEIQRQVAAGTLTIQDAD